MRRPSRRWLVPGATFALIVAAATLPGALSSADAAVPDLPTLTPAELLVKAQTADVSALSGTVELDNVLGLPDLGGLGDGSSDALTALLAGTHVARVAFDGPDRARVALPATLAETHWIVNGRDMWSWDSESQKILHAALPDHPNHTGHAHGAERDHAERPDADPAALARHLLDHVTPSTEVSVRSPRYVAGRAAYELALDPRSAASTVAEVTIAVDAETGLPLDVAVTAAGATSPAFEIGFTEVSFATPAPATFEFTPPPGSTVVDVDDPAALTAPGVADHHHRDRRDPDTTARPGTEAPRPQVAVMGEAWDAVAVVTGASMPPALGRLFDAAPQVSAGALSGRLVSTPLVNAVRADDGRIAVGAVSPDALVAALSTSG